MAETEPSAKAIAERIVDAHVDGLGAWKTETFTELLATLKTEFACAIEQAAREARAAAFEDAKQAISEWWGSGAYEVICALAATPQEKSDG